ncbi:Asp-tRNA(Asn)/Glu-tRNA(Gln) amidotransferase subunit GatC [Candidatus Saccharibacteria bacterium]|nr:Asp-tRNA(Asn)/Glu-tRNA(Gln) amidotransferase subunit GatC [Candidatus Saccharibacteria bacterium]
MEINCEQLDYLSDLSNFNLSDAEKQTLGPELENIIKYISELDELDVSGVEPTSQVFDMENIWRSDEILPQDADREQLLALTKEERDHQIKVPKVL